jgi:hypothetical protein
MFFCLQTAALGHPLEMDRAMWCTAKNLKQDYNMLAEVFVSIGVAVHNPEYDSTCPFDPTKPTDDLQTACQPILITKPDRIVSRSHRLGVVTVTYH